MIGFHLSCSEPSVLTRQPSGSNTLVALEGIWGASHGVLPFPACFTEALKTRQKDSLKMLGQ